MAMSKKSSIRKRESIAGCLVEVQASKIAAMKRKGSQGKKKKKRRKAFLTEPPIISKLKQKHAREIGPLRVLEAQSGRPQK
jgi:hypothetical protein